MIKKIKQNVYKIKKIKLNLNNKNKQKICGHKMKAVDEQKQEKT